MHCLLGQQVSPSDPSALEKMNIRFLSPSGLIWKQSVINLRACSVLTGVLMRRRMGDRSCFARSCNAAGRESRTGLRSRWKERDNATIDCCIGFRQSLWRVISRIWDFGTASILRDGRAVFNIAGNKYRIVVWINYPFRVVYVRFIGTHSQYDRIDAQTV